MPIAQVAQGVSIEAIPDTGGKSVSRRFLPRATPVITLRGLLFVLFAAWLILGPALSEYDIIAVILAAVLLAVVFFLTILCLIRGLALRKSFELQLSTDWQDRAFFSGKPATLVFKAAPFSIPPLFMLRIQVIFPEGGPSSIVHRLYGAAQSARFITQTCIFPHRGKWQIQQVRCSLEDQFGFSSFGWRIEGGQVRRKFMVRPPVINETALPLICSSRKSGDEVPDLHQRLGEPFDLKPYHPSDGMRKILWKVYAKSGELIARHPERSMSPEGRVAIFCLADRNEDHVCGHVLSYLRQLEDLDLEVLVGCEGQDRLAPAASGEAAEELFIDSVWQAGRGHPAEEDLSWFLAQAGKLSNQSLDTVVVFFDGERLEERSSPAELAALGDSLEKSGIRPVFAAACRPQLSGRQRTPGDGTGWRQLLMSWLVFQEPAAPSGAKGVKLAELARTCMARRWEILRTDGQSI